MVCLNPNLYPGQQSIMAALHPKSDYLYFVSDGNGGLGFAKTLDAHNRNVRLFRQYEAAGEGQGQMTKNASLASVRYLFWWPQRSDVGPVISIRCGKNVNISALLAGKMS